MVGIEHVVISQRVLEEDTEHVRLRLRACAASGVFRAVVASGLQVTGDVVELVIILVVH